MRQIKNLTETIAAIAFNFFIIGVLPALVFTAISIIFE